MRAALDELVGLFVDDGFLAVALLAWCALVGVAHAVVAVELAWGPVLAVGCAAILLATIRRAARSR